MGVSCTPHLFTFDGWRAERSILQIERLNTGGYHPLLKSDATPPGGIEGQFIDPGRGLEADFACAGTALGSRIAMVDQEVMLAAETFHHRRKLRLAGAVGVLVVSRIAGEPVTGPARTTGPGLFALGIMPEAALALWRKGARGEDETGHALPFRGCHIWQHRFALHIGACRFSPCRRPA